MAGKKPTPTTGKGAGSEVPFEKALDRLEQIVETLEGGDTSLEKALELFEEGVVLSRRCNQRLEAAERRLEVLAGDNGEGVEPLNEEEFRLTGEEDEEA